MNVKFALGQINPTVGDFAGNTALIATALAQAEAAQADVLVLPELALCGYPPRDLLTRDAFLGKMEQSLEQVASLVGSKTAVLVGFAERLSHTQAHEQPHAGRPLANSAAFLFEGRVQAVVRKRLLPTYDVFDEDRYFQGGTQPGIVNFRGHNLGIIICEDAWNDETFWPHRRYALDPVAEVVKAGADILVNLSASPFGISKHGQRLAMLTHTVKRWQRPLVFVNQVGAHDDILFDGGSFALNASGAVVAQAHQHQSDFLVVDTQAGGSVRPTLDETESLLQALVLGTRDYARRCGFKHALLGLSGGIDSAVVACIAAAALGPENVHGVALPSRYSSEHSRSDAQALTTNLGIRFSEIPIEAPFAAFLQTLAPTFEGRKPDVTEENLQARLRGTTLMALSNKFGGLLLTTGNKSEIATGYSTLYGDMCGGLGVIADVFKLRVYELARHINRDQEIIPASTIDKPPSAELRPDQKDEDSLPPYSVLDPLLEAHLERDMDAQALVDAGFDATLVRDILRLVRLAEHKRRQSAPGLKVSAKAFGTGRRFPIAHGFRDPNAG